MLFLQIVLIKGKAYIQIMMLMHLNKTYVVCT